MQPLLTILTWNPFKVIADTGNVIITFIKILIWIVIMVYVSSRTDSKVLLAIIAAVMFIFLFGIPNLGAIAKALNLG